MISYNIKDKNEINKLIKDMKAFIKNIRVFVSDFQEQTKSNNVLEFLTWLENKTEKRIYDKKVELEQKLIHNHKIKNKEMTNND